MIRVSFEVFRCLLLALLLNACTSNQVPVESKDSVTFATLETSFLINRSENRKIKLAGTRTSGDFGQTVPTGKYLDFEDLFVSGPTDVQGTTDLTYVSVSVGREYYNLFNDSKLHGLMYFGVAQTDLDLSLIHQNTTYTTNKSSTELYLQVGGAYEMAPSLSLESTLAYGLGASTEISEFDLRLNYALYKHLEIMGGLRFFSYYYIEDSQSDIHVDFKGVFIGLNVPF